MTVEHDDHRRCDYDEFTGSTTRVDESGAEHIGLDHPPHVSAFVADRVAGSFTTQRWRTGSGEGRATPPLCGYLPTHLGQVAGVEPSTALLITLVIMTLGMVIAVVNGFIVDRIGRRPVPCAPPRAGTATSTSSGTRSPSSTSSSGS